jgi:8-oxo-dGTP diphosphatase
MAQARAAIPVLAAYGVTRVVTSSSVRCEQSVRPYAERYHLRVRATADLSEEDATDESVRAVVDDLLHAGKDAVICTHRPVLPTVYDALGLVHGPHPTGQLVVVHHRKGRVHAIERHLG